MKVKVIWSLTVFQQILLNIVTVFAIDENSLSRSAYFTTRQNKKLIGHVVQRFESPSLMSCSHSCMRNTWCSSTNFEQLTGRSDKGTCELNKHDISTVNKDTNFQDREGSTFSLHLKVIILGCLLAVARISFSQRKLKQFCFSHVFFYCCSCACLVFCLFDIRAASRLDASMVVLVCLTRRKKCFHVHASCRGLEKNVEKKRVRS